MPRGIRKGKARKGKEWGRIVPCQHTMCGGQSSQGRYFRVEKIRDAVMTEFKLAMEIILSSFGWKWEWTIGQSTLYGNNCLWLWYEDDSKENRSDVNWRWHT